MWENETLKEATHIICYENSTFSALVDYFLGATLGVYVFFDARVVLL